MATNYQNKEKDQKDIERLVARSLARKFPLYESGRCTVGFLEGMVSQALTNRITDLLTSAMRHPVLACAC